MYYNLLFRSQFIEDDIREFAYVEHPVVPSDGDTVRLNGEEYKVRGAIEYDYDVFGDEQIPRVSIIVTVKPIETGMRGEPK